MERWQGLDPRKDPATKERVAVEMNAQGGPAQERAAVASEIVVATEAEMVEIATAREDAGGGAHLLPATSMDQWHHWKSQKIDGREKTEVMRTKCSGAKFVLFSTS